MPYIKQMIVLFRNNTSASLADFCSKHLEIAVDASQKRQQTCRLDWTKISGFSGFLLTGCSPCSVVVY